MFRFPCNRIQATSKNRKTTSEKQTPMIDQQIEIPTKDGTPPPSSPIPSAADRFPSSSSTWMRRRSARNCATWRGGSAPSGYYVMLPNMYYRSGVMELGPIPPDPEAPERKRMFELHELDRYSDGDGRHQGAARLCRQAAGRECEDRRHRRLLHERPLCRQRGHAFSGPGQGRGLDLRHASRDRPARQPASGRAARPRPSCISAAPKPTSTRRRKSSTRSRHR